MGPASNFVNRPDESGDSDGAVTAINQIKSDLPFDPSRTWMAWYGVTWYGHIRPSEHGAQHENNSKSTIE